MERKEKREIEKNAYHQHNYKRTNLMFSVPLSGRSKSLMFTHFQGQFFPLLLTQNRAFACRVFQRDKSECGTK